MRPNNAVVVNQLSVGTASFVSSAFWIQDVVRASFQFVVASGSFNGSLTLQVSNDLANGFQNQFSPTNWSTLGSVTVVASASANTVLLIQASELCYEYGRIQFTASNGGAALGLVNGRMKVLGI